MREVLTYQSVSLAAERLGVTQSAVSQQLARFEKLSGIPVMARNGGSFAVRGDEVGRLLAAMVEAADTLSRVASGNGKFRLGLCDDLAVYYCHSIALYRELECDFDVHVGHPSGLAEMFGRGELDVVIRPLFHREVEMDLMMEIPLVWVTLEGKADPAAAAPVILETHLSPYAYYTERPLREARVPYKVVAHIDDYLIRSRFVAQGLGHAAVPAFLLSALPEEITQTQILPSPHNVRYALFRNSKTISYRDAETIFERVRTQIEDGRQVLERV
ncbi:LysR family transcriptional regulator [Pelagibacterium halotolerans]|uniref:LysR family transcriptional regulator n=1 Tax=Pelagibacterium halotolerans TaxID=531813 RepID=UPI00384ED5E3